MFLWRFRIPRQLQALAWAARTPGGMVRKVSVWTHFACYSRTYRPIDERSLREGHWRLERCSCGTVPDVVSGGGENVMIRCPKCRRTCEAVGDLAHVVSLWNAK